MINIISLILRFLIVLLGVIFVFDIPTSYLGMAIWREQIGLVMMGIVTADIFVVINHKRENRRQLDLDPGYLDLAFAISSLLIFGYATWNYEDLITYGYMDNTAGIIVSVLAILIISETTRRTSGWPLIILMAVFFIYGISANHFPGILEGREVSLYETLNYTVLDPSGLLGTPLAVVTTTVLAFVIFGAALFTLGGGRMFLDFAIALMKNIRGGTAKSSILASSLFGSISGSAVGNVVTTGIVTIPLMKRSGYNAREAGAIEAVASTGGQLMPPIMGSAAFIMADIISVPYQEIVKAALLPGILFYFTLFLQVHFRASRKQVQFTDHKDVPSIKTTFHQYWPFLVPIALLLYLLFTSNQLAQKTALFASGACIIAAIFTPERPNVKRLIAIIDTTGAGMMSILPAVAVAGIIIGILSITGLGFNFGMGVVEQSGGSLVILLLLTAIAALVLGMGLPTTAVYILMASLVAPALVQAGIETIPAHLFVLYFGVLSMITPPICFASIAAASIAESDFIKTGMESMKLGISGFFVPFIFVTQPDLLSLNLTDINYWINISGVMIAFLFLAGVIEGHLFKPLTVAQKVLLSALIITLFLTQGKLVINLLIIVISAALIFWLWKDNHSPEHGNPV
ncbi:MAG: TRAP transporter fused permease subunit [Gammaproteobacteria bacterium]|nr:TRAP transporter fused permease subunit [Gammaproteobacteria bacterium]